MAGTVKALEATAQGFANAVKRLAIQDKDFAMELAFIHNIRSQITPKALKQITKDMFDKGGKLTESGRQEINRVIQQGGLDKNATWDEVLRSIAEKKRAFKAELVKRFDKIPKINDIIKIDSKCPTDNTAVKLNSEYLKKMFNEIINKKPA